MGLMKNYQIFVCFFCILKLKLNFFVEISNFKLNVDLILNFNIKLSNSDFCIYFNCLLQKIFAQVQNIILKVFFFIYFFDIFNLRKKILKLLMF